MIVFTYVFGKLDKKAADGESTPHNEYDRDSKAIFLLNLLPCATTLSWKSHHAD